MNSIEVDQLGIHLYDVGKGEPVILLHCSSASHKAWRFLFDDLHDGYRVLAPDLVGYGQSDRWPAHRPYDVLTDIHVVERLLDMAGQPCHIIGHSYGAEMGLEAARLNPHRVKSLCLIEPVAFHLLKGSACHQEWLRITGIGDRVADAMREGQAEKAAGISMSYWIGRVRWLFMPKAMKQRIVSTMDKVVCEFSTIRPALTQLDEYRLNAWPINLVEGSRTRPTAHCIIELLKWVMPEAQHQMIQGAGHMSPFTHSQQVHDIVMDHLQRYS